MASSNSLLALTERKVLKSKFLNHIVESYFRNGFLSTLPSALCKINAICFSAFVLVTVAFREKDMKMIECGSEEPSVEACPKPKLQKYRS